MDNGHIAKAHKFHELHANSFVLPNAWDAISAKVFEDCGFQTIGTTSAGIANSQGYPDRQIPFKQVLNSIEQIINSVHLPVSVDLEDGYGQTIEEVVEVVKQVMHIGAVGINIEDSTMNSHEPLYHVSLQQKKIAAIKELTIKTGIPLLINARTDMYWLHIGTPSDRFEETVKRALAYQESGADCIFVPGIGDLKDIQALRSELSCAINILASPTTPPISELSGMGIQRISCGSGPFRAAITTLRNIGNEIIQDGTFQQMTTDVISYQEVNNLFHPKVSP